MSVVSKPSWVVVIVENDLNFDTELTTKTYSLGEYDNEADAVAEQKRLEKQAEKTNKKFEESEGIGTYFTITCNPKVDPGFNLPKGDDDHDDDDHDDDEKEESDIKEGLPVSKVNKKALSIMKKKILI